MTRTIFDVIEDLIKLHVEPMIDKIHKLEQEIKYLKGVNQEDPNWHKLDQNLRKDKK